jgi:hypothetical protein
MQQLNRKQDTYEMQYFLYTLLTHTYISIHIYIYSYTYTFIYRYIHVEK